MSEAGKHILIVEDDAASRERLRDHLTMAGYAVTTAADGDSGLALARRERPDLVITDLILPGKNGFRFTAELKADPELARIPVMWVTAFCGEEEIRRQVQDTGLDERLPGLTAVLYKPFRHRELLQQVRQLLGEADAACPACRVLVVDDDPANLELIERRLEVENFATALAETGAAALERIRHERFDAVLLDLRLPDMDGLEVLAAMREQNGDFPVIVMTAHGSEAIAVKALTAGATDYLIKPVGRRDLVAALRNAIEKHRLQLENRRIQKNLFAAMLALQQSLQTIERDHRRLTDLLESVEVGVLILDAAGQIELLNPKGAELLRLGTPPVTRGTLFSGITAVRDERGEAMPLEQLFAVPGSKIVDVVCFFEWADGVERALLMTANPLLDEAGACGGLIMVFRDITERYARNRRIEALLLEQEQALRMADQRLQQEVAATAVAAEHMKNDVLSAVSHELKTPLSLIVGFASLLAEDSDGNLTPAQRQMVERIRMGADRLSQKIEDLLDYAMLTGGMLRPQHAPVPLAEVARGVVEVYAGRAQERGVYLGLDLQVPDARVQGDAALVRKILDQLLSNAVKFIGIGGQIMVRIGMSPDGAVVLAVEDTGIGIDPEILPRIFDRFYQAEGHSTGRFGGMGLGLALVKGFADLMGARVEAESKPGQGSTFRVVWPAGMARAAG